MTRILSCVVVLFFAVTASCGSDDEFPQKLQTGPNGAVVRCGPGEAFYGTDRLPADVEIEVWRREPSGWLAIRPVATSYSLVSARDVRCIANTDLAEVQGSDAVAWIGSSVGHSGDYKWQVRLKSGEKLAVLGQEQHPLHAGNAPESLFRIAPPAGEFRWVRQHDVSDSAPTGSTPDTPATAGDAPIRLAEYQIAIEERPAVVVKPSSGAEKPPATDGFVPRKSSANVPRPTVTEAKKGAAWTPVAKRTSVLVGSFADALRDAELRLSLMVAQPASTWDLDALRADGQTLVRRGTSTLERARAQRFLEQVEEFASLQQRFVALNPGAELDVPSGTAGDLPTEPDAGLAMDPRFDGMGWLLPVHSTQRTAPPYALLDSEGRIIQFVSPAPGLNLHRYLRKEIGVYGERSFAATLAKPHVVAHRVVELDRHRR